MIKTVSINLGGIVFQIDEDAYEALSKYLNDLKQYYKYTEGRDEIVADIESRLAELFNDSFAKSGFSVISMGDVLEVIEIMGRPEDFDDEEETMEDAKQQSKSTASTGATNTITNKRLYRDVDDAIIAGVASGLSVYFGIKDPLWIRLLFILFTIGTLGTIAPIIYIVLWAIVEPAATTAQKLAMRGEPINVNNLEKRIKEEFERAGDNLKGFASKQNTNGALAQIVNVIGKLFGAVARFIWIFVKVIFFLVVGAVCLALIAALFSALISLIIALPLALKYIFSSGVTWVFAAFGAIVVIGIPAFLLIYLPYRFWTRKRTHNKFVLPMAGGLFVLGLISLGITTAEVASYFSTTEVEKTEYEIPQPATDTLYLSINDEVEDYRAKGLDFDLNFSSAFSFTKHLEAASDWVELDVKSSKNGTIYLEKVAQATGKNYNIASETAKAITHEVKIVDNQIIFDQFFGLGKDSKWRNQKVKLTLYVPDSIYVSFSKDMDAILNNVENAANVNNHTVAGNRWLMNEGILQPVDSVLNFGNEWSKQNMEAFDFKDFKQLKVKGNVIVEIVQGGDYEVFMSSNKMASKHVEVQQDGDELTISAKSNRGPRISMFWLSNNHHEVRFYVAVPNLEFLNVGGQSSVILSDFKQDKLECLLNDQCELEMQNVNFAELQMDLSNQSNAILVGSAKKLNLDASDQSDVDGEEFTVDQVYLNLSGQSSTDLKVTGKIAGQVSDQSYFEYWGNPNVDVSKTDQADISQN
jgi:phage shock protein PspC (stress-responsive transcriptional regulator)